MTSVFFFQLYPISILWQGRDLIGQGFNIRYARPDATDAEAGCYEGSVCYRNGLKFGQYFPQRPTFFWKVAYSKSSESSQLWLPTSSAYYEQIILFFPMFLVLFLFGFVWKYGTHKSSLMISTIINVLLNLYEFIIFVYHISRRSHFKYTRFP